MNIAKTVSTITNPPIICIPLFLIISVVLAEGDINKFIVLEAISLIFSSILPMAIILGWAKRLGTDRDISNRTDRFVPLIVGIISYFIGFLVSLALNVDMFMTILLLCYAINTFIVMMITRRWKISIHTTGLSGPVGALILLLGPWGAVLGVIFPILIWSRLTLNKHTMAQAVYGGVQGFFLTVLEMFLIVDVFGISLNIHPLSSVIWLIIAIIAAPVVLGVLSYADIKNRKIIFYATQAVSLIIFLMYAPSDATAILILNIIASVLVSLFSSKDYPWNQILF